MSNNPLKARMRASLQNDGQSKQQEPVSAIEAPLRNRNRFRAAEQLGETAAPAVPHVRLALAPAASAPVAFAPLTLPDDTEWSEEYRLWCVANAYQPGSLIEVGLNQVKESPFNPRHFYIARRLEDLIPSIAEQGQQQAIHVVPDYDRPGEFFLHDGGRRVRALRALKHAKARATVVDVPIGIQSYKLGYELNTRRDNQTPFDNAVKWTYLLENGHFSSQKELAETLGQDESTVSQTLTIGKLPEEVMVTMLADQERFPVRVAYEVSKFHQDNEANIEQTLDLVERIVRSDMKVRQVIEFRSRFNATRRGEKAPRAVRTRSNSASATALPEPAIRQAASPTGAGTAAEEYQLSNGRIRATLSEREGGIVLDVQGAEGEELTAIAQSLRHFLTSLVH